MDSLSIASHLLFYRPVCDHMSSRPKEHYLTQHLGGIKYNFFQLSDRTSFSHHPGGGVGFLAKSWSLILQHLLRQAEGMKQQNINIHNFLPIRFSMESKWKYMYPSLIGNYLLLYLLLFTKPQSQQVIYYQFRPGKSLNISRTFIFMELFVNPKTV